MRRFVVAIDMPAGDEKGGGAPPVAKRMEHLASAVALAMTVEAKGAHETTTAGERRVSTTDVEKVIEDWPKAPQMTARMLLERYGAPNEATPTRLAWYGNAPWKRTVVTRDVYTHHFPMPHSDFLSSTIDYRVPLERYADVARFDGSCLPDRTAGEVTARCDGENANILTLNMMHDIVTGARSVEEARSFFAEQAAAFATGRPAPYMERLQFELPRDETEDLDEANIAREMIENVQAKAKEMMPGRR